MNMPTFAPRAYEKKLIGTVQACRSKLPSLHEDDTWRAFLVREVGKNSLRAMTSRELHTVIDALRRDGAPKTAGKAGRAKANTAGRAAPRTAGRFVEGDQQIKMIRGLWIELAQMRAVRDSSEEALQAFVRRMTSVDSLAWLNGNQANRVIEALKSWRTRAENTNKGDAQ